jgi:hypothetical protein
VKLTADPAAYTQAVAELNAPGDRHAKVAGALSAAIETVATHGTDGTGVAMLRRALAWIDAEQHTRPAGVYEREPDDYNPVVWPLRTSRFEIYESDVSGYTLRGRP